MTQIEKKLNKLPESFIKRINGVKDTYEICIFKKENHWIIQYKSKENEYIILEVIHDNLQAAVDTTLAELKKIRVNV